MTAVSSTAQYGRTPLHWLCTNKNGTVEIVHLLFKLHPTALGADANWLHALCMTVAITLEALQPALDALAPGDVEQKLGAKDRVRPAAPATHAR